MLDLHVHSSASADGKLAPRELIAMLAQNKIRVAAIADHNTTRAIPCAMNEAESAGIELIAAIEMDCLFQGIGLHLLGYGIGIGLSVYKCAGASRA